MHDEAAFLRALQQHPEDTALRLVFADWLEERGDSRGELIRLLHALTQSVVVQERDSLEERLRNLLAGGVKPVGPVRTNRIGMPLVLIPPGTFNMGSPKREKAHARSEKQVIVTLTRGFWMGKFQVTQEQWTKVMGRTLQEQCEI